jgi:uncharacterized protein (DUF2252 family)
MANGKSKPSKVLFDGAARAAAGKALREKVPRSSHAECRWNARRDPIATLLKSNEGRVAHLLPIRYGRMLQSPFAFYRGAAAVMALDLSRTASTGIRVQACGDCHLANFGGFATPERRLIFDINDFDETLPAPWEWDVKRLAASFVIAARNNGFKSKDARAAAVSAVRSYRERLAEYATWPALDVWYASITAEMVIEAVKDAQRREFIHKRGRRMRAQAIPDHDFPKLTQLRNGRPAIKDNPPLIYHPQDEAAALKRFYRGFEAYRETLPPERRTLLDRYRVVDVAAKVVGVGSVGTRCGVILLMASERDPLFLQLKEARASVLEPYAGKSAYANNGQRVVVGQRLTQPASDIFLGWTETDRAHFYVRQLRDMKFKPLVESMNGGTLRDYAGLCGWALARAHAKSGDAVKISGYLGKKPVFDEAIGDFAKSYADQNELDHAALAMAVREGKVEAEVVD